MTRFPRPVALAAVALTVVATAGCSVTNPATTSQYYMASDGVEAVLGPNVVVTNVLVVAEDQDSPGSLIARVVNQGSEDASVQLTSTEADVDLQVQVPPGRTVTVGPGDDEEVVIDPVGKVPGQSLRVTASLEGGQESQEMRVPVLDGTLSEYSDLLP